MKRGLTRDQFRGGLAIATSVVVISILHYVTSLHSVVLHEIFKRLYYIPVVVAAVMYGARAGLATSGFATLLYVPHIVMAWHGWPVLQMDQYGDVLLFTLVAGVTGGLADRLRTERDRYRAASLDLEAANRELVARTNERIHADRFVAVGRLASGIAHEVRNPLAALLGCVEILENVTPLTCNQREFLGIARSEIARVNRVVGDFLEFAHPPSASRARHDFVALAQSAVRLAQPNLSRRGIGVELAVAERAVAVQVDAQQLQRAIVNLLLDQFAPAGVGTVRVSITADELAAQTRIEVPGVGDAARLVKEVFEPFPERGNGHGLSLAIARRLIENQGGSVRAEADDATLRYIINLPLAPPDEGTVDAAACVDHDRSGTLRAGLSAS